MSDAVDRVVAVAWQSQKDRSGEILEGRLLHDAHLLEGGTTFLIVKCLVTGTARGQNFDESLRFLEESVLGRFCCYFPEHQRKYAEAEAYARAFLEAVRAPYGD